MNNLKSCPFCGGVAELNAPGYEHYSPCWFKCTQCGAEGPTKASELEAQEEWNRRAQERFDRWISVKDRLPEREGRYLVWGLTTFVSDHADESNGYWETKIVNYYVNYGKKYFDCKVKCWTPLPEPPEEN